MSTHVPDSDDPLLSIWRLAWIAHILPTNPAELMNGNIFHPEPRTLAYTDAVLMQGLAAAPAIWSGLSPTFTYNLIILASIALSGWTMFLYARHLTNRVSAAVLAGIVFAFVPFRFDHLHHLELQATMFMPLALLWVDRALETGARRDVWLAVAAVVAQVYCGIYYAVFLATALLLVIPLRWRGLPAERRAVALRTGVVAARRRRDRGGAIPGGLCPQPRQPRRPPKPRHPAVLGDLVELPRHAQRKPPSWRVERRPGPERTAPVPRRGRAGHRGHWASSGWNDGESRCSSWRRSGSSSRSASTPRSTRC